MREDERKKWYEKKSQIQEKWKKQKKERKCEGGRM